MKSSEKLDAIEQLEADRLFIFDNWAELAKQYPGKVIGIYHGGILASAESFGALSKLVQQKRIAPSHVAMQYMNVAPDFIQQISARYKKD